MTYQLHNLSTAQVTRLHSLPILKQDQIKSHFGKPLDIKRAYDLVKETTNDFSTDNAVAVRLDASLWQLLQARDFFEDAPVAIPNVAPMSMSEASTDSEIAGTTEDLSLALAGLQTALEYETEGTDEYQTLLDAITGLEVAIQYN